LARSNAALRLAAIGLAALVIALALVVADHRRGVERPNTTPSRTADTTGTVATLVASGGQAGWSRTGAYLAGLSAFENRDMEKAAELLPLALGEDLSNQMLANQTLYALLSAGRIEQGIDLAKRLRANGQISALIGLARIQDFARNGDFKAAAAAAAELPEDRLLSITGPMLRAWAEMGAQGLGPARAALDPLRQIEGADALRLIQAALLQDHANERQGAEKSFREAIDGMSKISAQVAEFGADFWHRSGKDEDARAIIARYKEQGGGQTDEVAVALMTRLDRPPRQQPVARDPRQGMAIALSQIAMELLSEGLFGDALWLAQLSLDFNPELDSARLALGDIQRQNRHYDLAIAAYDGIRSDSIFYRASRLSTAESLRASDRADAAERLLRDLIAEGSDGVASIQLGNLLRIEKKFKESAEAYGMAIKDLGEPRREDWQLFYYRGIAHERAGDWPPAEAVFRKALNLSP
jgi:tetratricopeptide (TPR) repeat protein